MYYDHFRPPDHFSPLGKIAFRTFCSLLFIIGMSLFIRFVLPLVETHVSVPFRDWVLSLF
ncbi:hypothetical protein DY251_04995 [Mesorhizobium denitrificans]|uniref:Uncharacterized protein n=1 Tax=Mesorhizobium denitrificans TaxID=2294114 RepID=A0A371XGK0_9HYPH|nr:hypothetical protein DY251_04995 [Mesorhizobium denitrificans]